MFVVFNADTTHEIRRYKQYRHAREYLRVMRESPQYEGINLDVQYVDFYNQYIVYWKQVTNLMSREKVWQLSNTPRSCDVSSELYWSM